ncbi:MAG: hypothetical protein UT63_C0072G0014 [Candidatus Gottesmanbacteria bacterium GW2011_GWC2_39_8]|uniref:ABC transmembrane type-1 domain-containing protein n=1 Tax=Candidatus Gottesmanbacteria bacterium GW2011_GWC2_39_8 TaxID=1618450 RepID=A0A0G0PU05_9BACT|nr:MAG: hypothetical protein UT63_C0072G0014 [Candidatus Gottesmanbacteria bacterium GW2011_GWC2_39_8]
MNKEIEEIVRGFKRSINLVEKPERRMLVLASVIMFITGVLTNLPAIILGKLVDTMVAEGSIGFSSIFPFILLISSIILIREFLTVIRKYLVENTATQTEKKQTLNAVEKLLRTDIENINKQQIGSLHGRIFRSIEGLIRMLKLTFLDFFPIFFSALAAIFIAFSQKPQRDYISSLNRFLHKKE